MDYIDLLTFFKLIRFSSQIRTILWKQLNKTLLIFPLCASAVFGKSLTDTVTNEQRFGPHMVPILVQKCVEFIKEHGLDEEGIFRLPGQDNAVRQFRDAFDAGERPSFPR